MIDADEVARLCYERFERLPRRGKPEPGREWTLLAAVVKAQRGRSSAAAGLEVVSMGTGTKCIGQAAMSPRGDVLNDSHAEVIARRGCIRYLMEELQEAVSGRSSAVFRPSDQRGKWTLQPGVSFVFFTSHTPCGDASIIPVTHGLQACQAQPCDPVTPVGRTDAGSSLKRKAEEPEGPNSKITHVEEQQTRGGGSENRHEAEHQAEPQAGTRTPSEPQAGTRTPSEPQAGTRTPSEPQTGSVEERPQVPDVHRTGAKCVPGGPADPRLPGSRYHSTGLLRVKPGRGEPTLSLCCSDKLCRWGVLGFQGALLSHYLQEALYFSTLVVGRCPYSAEALHRAVIDRCAHVSELPSGFSLCSPVLLQSSLEFPFSQNRARLQHRPGQGRISPCGAAISWCHVTQQPLDVTANGFKHGVTRKELNTPAARSRLCKLELFHSFLTLVKATDPSSLPDSLRTAELETYWDYKQASQSYQQAWLQLRRQAFPLWPRADRSLLLFQ
ncbi:tRNA-specific adenosine deaminase 1 isoform X2 [Oryzias melastigma]|uniref:tRNA-specific adenosine deaminase 1 isoform X2 n=1 Tax=Oryzias melastigma TaxID=30732 RepID=UPI000CF7CC4D|nr:tRNA-specific adenosine deaminase 1 isoform X2 [Oryzias melastigma]